MPHKRLYKMVDQLVSIADTVVYQTPDNSQFQAQREMLMKFHDKFRGTLYNIIHQLEGEILVLRERNFDPRLLKMFHKLHQELIEKAKEISPEKPYEAAEKLVKYITERPSASVIDNLDFLGKDFIAKTNVDFKAGPILQHPQMRSLDNLKTLAIHLQQFMQEHPLVMPPSASSPPPARLTETMEEVPAFTAGKEEVTRR